MDYDRIRKDFYKGSSEEEMQDVLYKLCSTPVQSTFMISDTGVNTTPILSTWVDDLLYKAKRINNTMSPDEALQHNELIDKIVAYVKTKKKFFGLKDESEYANEDEYYHALINAIKTYFRNSQTSVVNATKVANFSPIAARKVYEKYCPKFNATVLDYSCGWMARMLGCLSSPYNYKYIGIEPNSKLNERLHEFSEWICNSIHRENNTVLYSEGSEVFHEELVNTVDISFSSPPYFNLEIYCNEDSQSANENTSFQAWVNHYMIPTIQNIYKYTKVGGLHIVNLKNLAGKEPLLEYWMRACQAVGFELKCGDYLIHQSRRQFDKGKNVNFLGDKEPIIVFIKNS